MGMFLAGYPDTTSIVAINRFCSSGIEAIAVIAAKIKSGKYLNIHNLHRSNRYGNWSWNRTNVNV